MRRLLGAAVVVIAAVYLWNASWLAPAPDGDVRLIAHRGVHQTFHREGLDNETCTAERIFPPEHEFIENTLPSMRAAFDAGADIVELDVHPTTDGHFAVMHDWTIDCRTEGTGETRSHDLAYLKTLDVGFGYTADGGATFPLRGSGVGMMPALREVLAAMPDRRFIVNFKSNEKREGDMLAELLGAHPEWRDAVWGVYGGGSPTLRARDLLPQVEAWTRGGLKQCLLRYVALGWTGHVPAACRDTVVMVPINVAPWLWGWPNRFQRRLADAGSEIILIGPYTSGDPGTAGIDEIALLEDIPADFSGHIWTNRIEIIGPALKRGRQVRRQPEN
jgi:glycerophosphoryl diester phosphodiesterase